MEASSMPFHFSYEIASTPLDETDVSIYQSLAQVHRGDFLIIKIHVRHRIICLTRPQLQQPPETIPYFESSYETTMLLSYPQFLESGLFSDFPDTIIPHELLHTMMPDVMTYARNLCERRSNSHGERSGCRMFNLVFDIVVERLYDDVVNRVMEESAREVVLVPASKIAIESLKKVNLEKGMITERCSICLEEFIGDEEVSAMPCKHIYHQECIIQWLERSDTCPLCRYSMSKSST